MADTGAARVTATAAHYQETVAPVQRKLKRKQNKKKHPHGYVKSGGVVVCECVSLTSHWDNTGGVWPSIWTSTPFSPDTAGQQPCTCLRVILALWFVSHYGVDVCEHVCPITLWLFPRLRLCVWQYCWLCAAFRCLILRAILLFSILPSWTVFTRLRPAGGASVNHAAKNKTKRTCQPSFQFMQLV